MISNTNFQRILKLLPNFLWPLKVFLIKNSIKSHGKKFQIGPSVVLSNRKEIIVGDNVFIGDGTIISGSVPVSIGNNVMFGPQVMIRGGDHNIAQVGLPMAKVKHGGVNLPIVIQDDVWIGTRAIILKGVTISEGSVIGAGALVNKNVLPYTINVGTPSRPVRCRFTKDDLIKHLSLVKSKFNFEQIEQMYQKFEVPFKKN